MANHMDKHVQKEKENTLIEKENWKGYRNNSSGYFID